MPEGAEVKIISEGLAKKVSGKTLSKVQILTGRYTRKAIPGSEHFTPGKVIGVGVKGKLIFWILNSDTFLLNTLGMTGTWSVSPNKHSRVGFCFTDGSTIYFEDMRNFGTLKFVRGKSELIKKINSLGPDMLNEDVKDTDFITAMDRKTHWTLAKAVMDQSVICGVGNYVKAEALYRAKLSPHRLVGSLSSADLSVLNNCIKRVLRQAYNRRGATIKTYKDVDGTTGDGSLNFLVYGKKQDPLGNPVVREKTPDGRTTHWVPKVQK